MVVKTILVWAVSVIVSGKLLHDSVWGGVGVAQPLTPDLPAKVNDLPQDEGVLAERAKDQEDASQQPDLQGRHLTRHWYPGPASYKKVDDDSWHGNYAHHIIIYISDS